MLIFAALLVIGTSNFPGVLAEELNLPAAPDCSLCHENGTTGRGTVNTPFGASMREAGLVASNAGSLRNALATLESESTDSDDDGTPDIEELHAGSNPNGEGGSGTPLYGCQAAGAGWWWVIVGIYLSAIPKVAVHGTTRGPKRSEST